MNVLRDHDREDPLRLFAALWLPPGLSAIALKKLERLRRNARGVRWVCPAQFHITLKFLGDTPRHVLPDLERVLAEVAAATSPITLQLVKGGVFPAVGPPRVVWIGLEPEAALRALADRITEVLEPYGFPPEKKVFSAHLTLGRAEQNAFFDYTALSEEKTSAAEAVSSLALVRSQLKPGGSVYDNIGVWPLAMN